MDRESFKRRIIARYNTRLHMSLILGATCLVGMLSSAVLLHAGAHDMRLRYPVVVVLAYLTFLAGIWVWLRLEGFERGSSSGDSKGSSATDGLDLLPSGGSSGGGGGGGSLGRIGGGLGRGGGTFDGGGASTSFAEGGGRAPLIAVSAPPSDTGNASTEAGQGLSKALGGFDVGGDDLGAIILLIVLAVAILAASGYFVWMAPDILGEAAFGAVLAGGLARRTREQTAAGWVAGVVRKTWWPFAIVMAMALAFAFYAKAHHPEARTFKEALHQAVSQ